MRKCKCGNQIANNAKTCPSCGHRFTSGLVKGVAVIFALPFFILIVAGVLNFGSSVAPTPQSSIQVTPQPPSVIKVASTGNEANDRLLALTELQKASALAHAVNEGCIGKRTFYMGDLPRDRSAFWSVSCKNGKSYLVQIAADAAGSTKVLECDLYRAVTKDAVFHKDKKLIILR